MPRLYRWGNVHRCVRRRSTLRLYSGNGMLRLYNGVGHRHHRAVGHQHLLPVGLQHSLTVQPETLLVALHKEVALRQVHLQGQRPQAHAQQPLQPPGLAHHTLEHLAVHLLRLRPRIAHHARPRPQTPLAAPLIPDDRAHRTLIGIIDSITLFCHKTIYFKRLIKSISYSESFF